MADTYSWKVAALDRELSDGSVYTVHYTVSASRKNPTEGDPDFTAGQYGSIGVTADPAAPGFIAYENLTEDDCIGWVKQDLGNEKVNSIEATISANLDEQINPTEGTGVPWATETTTD